MTALENAVVTQNAKLLLAQLGTQDPDSGMLLLGAPGDSADPGRGRYFTLLASHLVDQYVRTVPGQEKKVYDLSSPLLLGYADPTADVYHWRVQDDLETYVNAWHNSSIQEGIFAKVVSNGAGYAKAFCFFALRLVVAVSRREF